MATYPKVIFNETTIFEKADIRSATVTEEFNPLSITVPICRLDLELFSDSADFSILNPAGDYELLQHRQPLTVYEVVDGTQVFIGKYYLDTWDNETDNLIRFSCMDEIGLLDTLTSRGGIWLTPTNVGTIFQELFDEVGIQYIIDPDLESVQVTGWIPICTYREALQQLAFASGAYILTARQEGFVKIGRAEATGAVTRGIRCGVPKAGQSRTWKKRFRVSQWDGVAPVFTIDFNSHKLEKISLRTQVTGVEISMHDITPGTATRKLYEGTLDTGIYEIQFSQPMHTLSITGAAISASGANYAIISVGTDNSSVYLEGQVYNDSVTKYGVYMSNPGGVKENIITIPEASLVNSSNGQTIAQRVYDYYQKRHVQNMKLFKPETFISGEIIVGTVYNQNLNGIVEKMTIDLSGGFVASTEVVGEPVVV